MSRWGPSSGKTNHKLETFKTRDEVLHIGKSKNYLWRVCGLTLGIMNARLNLTCLISNIRRTVEACDKELMVNCCWGAWKGARDS